MDKGKTEEIAVGKLERVIDLHDTMQSNIKKGEKGISYDGSISLFNVNSSDRTKKSFEFDVPVQVKGHLDDQNKYLDKKDITYSIELEDLVNYRKGIGCIYFLVCFSSDRTQYAIFYVSLLLTKIEAILKKAEDKGNTDSIVVKMSRLDDDNDGQNLYRVLKQFKLQAEKIGFYNGIMMQNAISKVNIADVTKVSFTSVANISDTQFLKDISDGNIAVFGTHKTDKISFPIIWDENAIHTLGYTINEPVVINNRIFYEKRDFMISSDGERMVSFGDGSLTYNLNDHKYRLSFEQRISTIANDSAFLLENKKTFDSKDELRMLSFFIGINDILCTLNIEIAEKYSDLSNQEKNQLVNLYKFKTDTSDTELPKVWIWIFRDKYYPLIKIKELDSIVIKDAIYGNYQLFTESDGEYYRLPNIVVCPSDVLTKLYKLDLGLIGRQIDEADYTVGNASNLNVLVLLLINSYDISDNPVFLQWAESICYKLVALHDNDDALIYKLNLWQIKIRLNDADEDDLNEIRLIRSSDVKIMVAKYILLGEYESSVNEFNFMSKQEQDEFKKWPIYRLMVDRSKFG